MEVAEDKVEADKEYEAEEETPFYDDARLRVGLVLNLRETKRDT